jgi:hypothetical protein
VAQSREDTELLEYIMRLFRKPLARRGGLHDQPLGLLVIIYSGPRPRDGGRDPFRDDFGFVVIAALNSCIKISYFANAGDMGV